MKIKHKIMLLAIGSLLALSLCLSASYAFYIFRSSQDELNVANTDCFKITFNDGMKPWCLDGEKYDSKTTYFEISTDKKVKMQIPKKNVDKLFLK